MNRYLPRQPVDYVNIEPCDVPCGGTVGFTIEQQASEPQPGKRNRCHEEANQLCGQRGEAFTNVLKSALLGDFDDQFEQSLAIVLLGVKVWLGYEEGDRASNVPRSRLAFTVPVFAARTVRSEVTIVRPIKPDH